jgi:hypothetical protein
MYVWMLMLYFVCVDVGPRGREMELVREPAREGMERPPRGDLRVGKRCRRDEAGARLADVDRPGRRHRYDDPGVGPSHAPPTEASRVLEDFCCQLEAVL